MGRWICIVAGLFAIWMGIAAIRNKQADVSRTRRDPSSAFGTRTETETETGFAAVVTGIQWILVGIAVVVVGVHYF